MRRKLTPEQIKEILHLYHTVGAGPAYKLGTELGFAPSTIRKLAWKAGVRACRPSGEVWKPTYRRENDPRWARAIAIGKVVWP
jgi:hypothetical protein